MDRYLVVVPWKAAYSDPIALENGEELWLTGKTDNWDGHVWVWAKSKTGKEGWIPDTLVQNIGPKSHATAAFSALELTCEQDEELDALDETHGWILCRAANGLEGWVPKRNLAKIQSTASP